MDYCAKVMQMTGSLQKFPAYLDHFNKARPPVFYKFFPVETWLPELLSGRSLLFSSRTTFNDPFDCRPNFRLRANKEAISFFQSKLRGLKLSPARRLIKAIEGVRTVNADPRAISDHLQNLLDNTGVLCLAEKWDEPLMWSHYAKSHQGITVGFHSDAEIFQLAQPVIYTDTLPQVLIPVDESPQLFFDVFQNKDSRWQYEEEWRIVKPYLDTLQRDEQYRDLVCHTTVAEAQSLADQRGPATYQFPKTAIASVTLGMKIAPEDEKAVIKMIHDADLRISIYKVAPPSDQYLLKRELIKSFAT